MRFIFISFRLELNGLNEKKSETESLGWTDSSVEGSAEPCFITDNESAGSINGINGSRMCPRTLSEL